MKKLPQTEKPTNSSSTSTGTCAQGFVITLGAKPQERLAKDCDMLVPAERKLDVFETQEEAWQAIGRHMIYLAQGSKGARPSTIAFQLVDFNVVNAPAVAGGRA